MNFPDDLNEWSKKNFEDVLELFQKSSSVSRTEINQNFEDESFKENILERSTVIHQDDITNLKISLENTNSVDDFLKGI